MSNFQHPGEFIKTAASGVKDLATAIKANYNGGYSAVVGYLTADPIQPKLAK
jgi:hypothetical protein